MTLGPYASFIITSYALVTFVVAALIIWVTLDHRSQKQTLHDLEESGIRRRSARSSEKRSGKSQ